MIVIRRANYAGIGVQALTGLMILNVWDLVGGYIKQREAHGESWAEKVLPLNAPPPSRSNSVQKCVGWSLQDREP